MTSLWRNETRDIISMTSYHFTKVLEFYRWNEVTVVVILTSTVLLWFFREPGFMPGWSVLFKDEFVSDGTVAITMATLLFILPSRRPTFLGRWPADLSKCVVLSPWYRDWICLRFLAKCMWRAVTWSICCIHGMMPTGSDDAVVVSQGSHDGICIRRLHFFSTLAAGQVQLIKSQVKS